MDLAATGVSSRDVSECAQILSARPACRTNPCTDQTCRFSHPGDLLFDPAKGAPLCWPESFFIDTRPLKFELTALAWWLFGPAYEQLGSQQFQLRCAQHMAALEHFETREGARMVAIGLPEPDMLQSFALRRVEEIWGDVVHRQACQEYLDRSGEKTVSKITGGDYSAPSRRPVKAWDGPQGTVNIARIVKIALRNPNADFKRAGDTRVARLPGAQP